MHLKEQEVWTTQYCESLEKNNVDYYIMLSEFIDNSIANFNRNKKKWKKDSQIKINIVFDEKKYFLSFEDNCFGMNSFPYSTKDFKGEKIIEKKDDIKMCFDFFPTPNRKGIRKYGFGMKSAIYWIGKSWKVSTYVESLKSFCEISSSIKNIHSKNPKLKEKWSDFQNSVYKNIGTKIEIWDLSENQKKRFPKKRWLNRRYSTSDGLERKNYLIFILANKYKFYIQNNLEINFKFISFNQYEECTLNSKELHKYLFEFENFLSGYDNLNSNETWKQYILRKFDGSVDEWNQQIKNLDKPLIGIANNQEIRCSVFFDLLKEKKEIKKRFVFKGMGFDGKKKVIKVDLGLISHSSTKKSGYITFQAFQGISHFLNNIEITTRPHNHKKITGVGRGGAAYRIIAEVFFEEGYIEPDPNKRGFNSSKLGEITKWIKEIVKNTDLFKVSQILTDMNKKKPQNKKRKKENVRQNTTNFVNEEILDDEKCEFNKDEKALICYDKKQKK